MYVRRGSILALCGAFLFASTGSGQSITAADVKSIEGAVLAVAAEMTRAGEALDADLLFAHILDTDTGSIVQNGVVMVTRQEALDRVRNDLRGLSRVKYRWTRQLVTVLSPEVAILTAEGESIATTAAGDTFTAPFAQTLVFVLRGGAWKAIHAHHSSPRAR